MKLRKYLVDNVDIEVAIFEESVLQFYGNALKNIRCAVSSLA